MVRGCNRAEECARLGVGPMPTVGNGQELKRADHSGGVFFFQLCYDKAC